MSISILHEVYYISLTRQPGVVFNINWDIGTGLCVKSTLQSLILLSVAFQRVISSAMEASIS